MIYSNYFLPIWFTPSMERGSLRPTSFLLKPLPYRFLNYLPYFSQIPTTLSQFSFSADDMAVKLSVIDVQNIEGYTSDMVLRDILPQSMYHELVTTIRDYYFLLDEDKDMIDFLAEFLTNDRFQDDSWVCSTCKTRGLYKQRNCPLLSTEEQEKYFDPKFKLAFRGEILTQCPVGKIDHTKAVILSEASALFQKGLLPEPGGMGDQTLFFGYASQVMHHKIEARKQEMLDEQLKKNS